MKSIILKYTFGIACAMIFVACDSLLDVDPPKSRVTTEVVFSNDVTATTAVNGMYIDIMSSPTWASGHNTSIVGLTGLSADEFFCFKDEAELQQFEKNELKSVNPIVASLWRSMYKTIYEANVIIEQLNSSSDLTPTTKNQLLGEAHFVRSFVYFNLLNLFDAVPLATSTDYEVNRSLSRTPTGDIYQSIVQDLLIAERLLKQSYPSNGRVRPNRGAALALLARVHLYNQEWALAEQYSSRLLDTTQYFLETNLSNVFLATSSEAIWQLMPVSPGYNTNEGFDFADPEGTLKLTTSLVESFSPDDERRLNWITNVDDSDIYFPSKYKIRLSNDVTEYSMVLRLAEVYLIRAEARVKLQKMEEGADDLNMVRERAGLSETEATAENDLLDAIYEERKHELFAEWGHRWFDLKRTNRVLSELASKNGFDSQDTLYPLPSDEFLKNPRLGLQNGGY